MDSRPCKPRLGDRQPGRAASPESTAPLPRKLLAPLRTRCATPIPKPRKHKGAPAQTALLFDAGLSTQAQQYHAAIINGVRRPGSKKFTRGFLIVAPGITIKDRLRVLQANDPDSYYQRRELVPADLLADLGKARIVITNDHAFKRRERLELSRGGFSARSGPERLRRSAAGSRPCRRAARSGSGFG